MILAACALQLFTSRQNHRAQLDAAVRRARHLPRRLGGAQERRAARSPACASAGAARRPDSAADRKVCTDGLPDSDRLSVCLSVWIAVKPMLSCLHSARRCTPVHGAGRTVKRTSTLDASYTVFIVLKIVTRLLTN